MASYSTIPESEEELIEPPKQKSLTRLVAISALVSFAIGACAAALTYPGTPDSRPELVTKKTDNHWYDQEQEVIDEIDWSCYGETPAMLNDWTLSNQQTMKFWTSGYWPWPGADCQGLEKVETLVFVVHGNGNDGDAYLTGMWDAILGEIDPSSCNVGTHYVIAPQFYNKDNNDDRNIIKWNLDLQWATGQDSRTEKATGDGFTPLSSYQVIDEFIAWAASEQCTPKLKRLVIAGFSGGGQFVQRYALASQGLMAFEDSRKKVVTDVFIGAPASVAYLSDERPVLSRFDACWKKPYVYSGCKGFRCHLDVAGPPENPNMDLDGWANCLTSEPFTFKNFGDMTDAEKMPGTIGFTAKDCGTKGTKASSPVTAWNQWKYQTTDDEKAPPYLNTYFKHKSKFDKRYAERHTVWFVGSHDGESAAHSTWEHCADYVQGDSHLTIATAAFQYT